MNTQVMAFDRFSLDIPKSDLSFFKALVKKMGWTVKKDKAAPRKKNLYDPETGKYLNDETMKVIEDAENGIGLVQVGTFEKFKEWAENL